MGDIYQLYSILVGAIPRMFDVLRSIRTLSTIMSYSRNTVGAVAVVHHTDCGLLNFDNKFIKDKLTERVAGSPEPVSEVSEMEIGSLGR